MAKADNWGAVPCGLYPKVSIRDLSANEFPARARAPDIIPWAGRGPYRVFSAYVAGLKKHLRLCIWGLARG